MTPITPEQALQFIQAYVVRKVSLTDTLEPTARVLGRMEAYKDILDSIDTLMKRSKTKEIPEANRSHVETLSRN